MKILTLTAQEADTPQGDAVLVKEIKPILTCLINEAHKDYSLNLGYDPKNTIETMDKYFKRLYPELEISYNYTYKFFEITNL